MSKSKIIYIILMGCKTLIKVDKNEWILRGSLLNISKRLNLIRLCYVYQHTRCSFKMSVPKVHTLVLVF